MSPCCLGEEEERGEDEPIRREDVCCTDVVFLVIFIGFFAGLITIGAISIKEGDRNRLIYGFDSFGNTCGNKENKQVVNVTLSGRNTYDDRYMYPLDGFDDQSAIKLCVKKCPDRVLRTSSEVYNFYKDTGSKLCRYDIKPENYISLPNTSWSKSGPCPKLPVYPSYEGLAYCRPNPDVVNNMTKGSGYSSDDLGVFTKMLADIYASKSEIIYISLISFAMSLALILIMNMLAAVMVWVCVICSIVGSIAGTIALWVAWANARKYKKQLAAGEVDDAGKSNALLYFALAISWTVVTGFTMFFLFLWKDNLKSAVKLFKEARKCCMSMPLLLLQPVWTFLCFAAFMVYWTIVLAYIVTIVEAYHDNSSSIIHKFPVAEYRHQSDRVWGFFSYHLIGLIWMTEYMIASQQFVVAGAVALWFFTREKERAKCAPIKSLVNLLKHHLGSVAFGSILLVAVKLPRWIINYTKTRLDGSESRAARCALRCCSCCLWCLESCLRPLTQDAYTIVAIEAKPFCVSSRRAFEIVSGNLATVATVNTICSFVLVIGKLGIMAATCAIAIAWLDGGTNLHYPAMPVIFVSFIGYMIASCFLCVYEMVIDTLVLCHCEDLQINDGSLEKPYYMTESLLDPEVDGEKQPNTPVEM